MSSEVKLHLSPKHFCYLGSSPDLVCVWLTLFRNENLLLRTTPKRILMLSEYKSWISATSPVKMLWICLPKAWFPYRRTCRVCRTKKIHRTDRIHSILYNKLYLSFLLYWAFVREVSIKLYLSYEFFFVWQTRQIRQIQRYGNQA